jgi:hypothetical protein
MKVMESDSIISIVKRRERGFRKLRWKSYLNHLLNLWLYCGNFSVDCRSNGGGESAAANSANKIHPTSMAELGSAEPFRNDVSSASKLHDPKLCFNESNDGTSHEMFFRLIKPRPEGNVGLLKKSINHEKIPDDSSAMSVHHNRLLRAVQLENIVNTRNRITNDSAQLGWREKKWGNPVKSVRAQSENMSSIHNNQSSHLGLKPENQRKNTKTVTQILPIGNNASVESLSNHSAVEPSKVSLLGLFELTTHLGKVRWEGESELAAAKLAVRHINERRILPGYVLELITNDTQVRTESNAIRS